MEYLDISQITADGAEAKYISTMEVPDGTFERMARIPLQQRADDAPLKAFDVMFDEVNESGDLIGDSPMVIPPGRAIWLLKEFFHAPYKVSGKIKESPTK